MLNVCERCGKAINIDETFTICHGKVKRYNLAYLCEKCADELIAAEKLQEESAGE